MQEAPGRWQTTNQIIGNKPNERIKELYGWLKLSYIVKTLFGAIPLVVGLVANWEQWY